MMDARDRSSVEAVEVRCLKSMCGITKYDRMRNERIREVTEVKIRLEERVEQANQM